MRYIRHCMLGLALAATAFVSACGGGGGSDAAQPFVVDTDVPVNATQSPKAAVDLVRVVVMDEGENGDGLRIDAADLAISDTDEPEPDI